jgi:hypothetical protein
MKRMRRARKRERETDGRVDEEADNIVILAGRGGSAPRPSHHAVVGLKPSTFPARSSVCATNTRLSAESRLSGICKVTQGLCDSAWTTHNFQNVYIIKQSNFVS